MGALTRGGSIWSKIGGWFEDAWNAIKDTFCYIFGIDFTNETLNAEKCREFYDALDKGLNEIYKQFGRTNYDNWMKQIYTDKGKNPLICDMNIPGSHDSFTSYYKQDLLFAGLSDEYVMAQKLSVEEQWSYGIRYFDFRIANMKGLDWAHGTEFKNDCLGLYHTSTSTSQCPRLSTRSANCWRGIQERQPSLRFRSTANPQRRFSKCHTIWY